MDESKIIFIGEKPAPAVFKSYWEDDLKDFLHPKEDKKDKKDEKKKDEKFFEDKFDYKEDFGETMVGKKSPNIFIYTLKTNELDEIEGLDETLYPTYPMFDEDSKGIVFSAFQFKAKIPGLSYCLNRPASLYYVKEPKYGKKDEEKKEDDKKDEEKKEETEEEKKNREKEEEAKKKQDVIDLTPNDYMVCCPKFSPDFKKIIFFGSTKEFFSHLATFELKIIDWKSKGQPETIIPVIEDYNSDFSGIYGFQGTFMFSNFLEDSKTFVFQSLVSGIDILIAVDVETKEFKRINKENDTNGSNCLMRV
jgi:hypothetical protein